MLEEARILGGECRLDEIGRNLAQRNGVVLADAAAADDLAIGIGEGHRIFAAAVPHVAGTREGRKGEGQKSEAENHAEGDGVIEKIDEDAANAAQPEAIDEGRIGRTRPLDPIPGFEHGGADDGVEPPEKACDGIAGRQFGHVSLDQYAA